jgi:RecB family exonuclease
LAEYHRCAYRFYAERVLRLPATAPRGGGGGSPGGLPAADRGVLIHALLERLDFRRPLPPTPATAAAAARREGLALAGADVEEVVALVDAFMASDICRRLAGATQVRREQRFGFLLADGLLMTGALDVLAREPGGMLVVDYKSDRLGGAAPADALTRQYAAQRLIYALAVLRSGAERVEVAHVFLECPHEPVAAVYGRAQVPELTAELAALADGVLQRRFPVTDAPQRLVCEGCPAEGGLCSWPLAMTRREAPDQLF